MRAKLMLPRISSSCLLSFFHRFHRLRRLSEYLGNLRNLWMDRFASSYCVLNPASTVRIASSKHANGGYDAADPAPQKESRADAHRKAFRIVLTVSAVLLVVWAFLSFVTRLYFGRQE